MKKRVFKIKICDKESGKIRFIIMGDSYKPFEDHFLDIVGSFTKRWVYDDTPEGGGRCLGREMEIKFLEVYESKGKFVSYGGLKFANEEIYDKEVEEHNKNCNDEACPYLSALKFVKKEQNYLDRLLRECRVMDEEIRQEVLLIAQ